MSSEKSDFHVSVEQWVNKGYGMHSCDSHCPDRGQEHAHLTVPGGGLDFIAYPDGTVAGLDLTHGPALTPVYTPFR